MNVIADTSGDEHEPFNSAECRPRLCHRYGRQLHDAGTGLLGGHQAHRRLRQRLRHRRRRLLHRIHSRSVHLDYLHAHI